MSLRYHEARTEINNDARKELHSRAEMWMQQHEGQESEGVRGRGREWTSTLGYRTDPRNTSPPIPQNRKFARNLRKYPTGPT